MGQLSVRAQFDKVGNVWSVEINGKCYHRCSVETVETLIECSIIEVEQMTVGHREQPESPIALVVNLDRAFE